MSCHLLCERAHTGDIATSPLYCLTSIFDHPPEPADVMGALTLIFWTLTLIGLVKYVGVVLYANDDGEGGAQPRLLPAFSSGNVCVTPGTAQTTHNVRGNATAALGPILRAVHRVVQTCKGTWPLPWILHSKP